MSTSRGEQDQVTSQSSVHGERPPLVESPTPETEESSSNSTSAVLQALSIYEETSGILSRTRDFNFLSNGISSFFSADSTNDESHPMKRTRIRTDTSQILPSTGPDSTSNTHIFSTFDRKTTENTSKQSSPSPTYRNNNDNSNNSDKHNNQLIHRLPLNDHSSQAPQDKNQNIRRTSSFTSKQSEGGASVHKILVTRSYEVKEHILESIFYVSTSAILGSIVRTYLTRIFGFDCENNVVNDFLTSLTSNICVTNGGRTFQTGGALFYDFPANVLGSFILGVVSPRVEERRSRFPWLHRDHALQRDDVFHASLATGFCGCLTTFASWNTQMIVMLDGTYCELGSQVVAVLFGYSIGLMGATCGFQFGRQCGLWMYNLRHAGQDEVDYDEEDVELNAPSQSFIEPGTHSHQGVELVDDDEVKVKPIPNHLHKIPLFLAAAGFLAAFIVGNVVQDIQFYRAMTQLWFLSPAGSLLRWKLSELNLRNGEFWCFNLPHWVPWGTFAANMLAAVTAALLTGIDDRYFSSTDPVESNWILGLLFALSSGFAGSLSTVSTMIKETVLLSEAHVGYAKAHYYAVGTCFTGMLLGLTVYSITVRIHV
jgi:fluoride ion exporter CrcB/FEX